MFVVFLDCRIPFVIHATVRVFLPFFLFSSNGIFLLNNIKTLF